MKFEFKSGLIWIPIEINYEGKWQVIENCILDTGSASTAIDIDHINFNFNKPAKIKRLLGIGTGTQEVLCQSVAGLKINEKVLSDIEIEFGNFKSTIGITGFIGNDILSRFKLFLDFPRYQISLS
jgi:hypothetical protein